MLQFMTPRLSWFQKRMVRAALRSGAATAKELAEWSGLNPGTIYGIVRISRSKPSALRNEKRYKYHAAYQDCWMK